MTDSVSPLTTPDPSWLTQVVSCRRLVPHWPALESFALQDCTFYRRDAPSPYLGSSPRSLRLTDLHSYEGGLVPCLVDRPLSTSTLAVDKQYFLLHSRPDQRINTYPQVAKLAAGLKAVTLIDMHELDGYLRSECPRGALEGFVAALEKVERLTISPAALKDLSTLAGLRELRRLDLLQGAAVPQGGVDPSELVALFRHAHKFKWVATSDEISRDWSAEEKRSVEMAAAGDGIELTRI